MTKHPTPLINHALTTQRIRSAYSRTRILKRIMPKLPSRTGHLTTRSDAVTCTYPTSVSQIYRHEYVSFHLQTNSSSKYKRTNQKAANIDTTLFNKSSHTRSNILFCFTEMFDSHLGQIASFMLCTLYEIQKSTLAPCHVQLKHALGRTQLS